MRLRATRVDLSRRAVRAAILQHIEGSGMTGAPPSPAVGADRRTTSLITAERPWAPAAQLSVVSLRQIGAS